MKTITALRPAEAISNTQDRQLRHFGKLTTYSDGSLSFESPLLVGDCVIDGALVRLGDG